MVELAARLALVCTLVGACCPSIQSRSLDAALPGNTPQAEDKVSWNVEIDGCKGSPVANAGSLSILFDDAQASSGAFECRFGAKITVPAGLYVRAVSYQARGNAELLSGNANASGVLAIECGGNETQLLRASRDYAPASPSDESDNASAIDLAALSALIGAKEEFCANDRREMQLAGSAAVKLSQGSDENLAQLDSIDITLDLAECGSFPVETLCDAALRALPGLREAGQANPMTRKSALRIIRYLDANLAQAMGRECASTSPDYLRRAAAATVKRRANDLRPSLTEICNQATPTSTHDLELIGAIEEQRCQAREALQILGTTNEQCSCNQTP